MDVDDMFSVFDEVPQAPLDLPASIVAAAAEASAPMATDVRMEPITGKKRTAGDDIGLQRAEAAAEVYQNLLDDERDAKLKKAKLAEAGPSSMDLVPMQVSATVISSDSKECVHEVAVPPGYDYVPLSETKLPEKPAKEYPFTLDPFQREAVKCIERNESVLVSAHTSAGKTVVAEYAIAKSLRDKQRVIYTSPIKALSNQKYREMQEEFVDVGLMTGDVTINPNASCIVMTTEILRSMLYRGSEMMREVGWVVFDEIHYMRDKERGVVWEETLILLPDNVHFVFLSATIPNALQFAKWICQLHKQPCHVVYTDYRPTPLQHYMFPAGGDGLHLVVDERGNFREEHFMKAMVTLSEQGNSNAASKGGGAKGKKGGKNTSDCMRIVKMIMEKKYQPVIIFSFSKRECEAYALQMSKLDFNTEEEREAVQTIFSNAIDQLSDDDKKLPQIEHVLPLLKRGIGIHHSGLLPILKEVIEILFGEGLVKALFATETFAMGLNMPARTVVFTNVRKFDGKDFRWVTSGEYIQMSGRAGRRGLDDRGIVILMVDEKMEPPVAKGLLKGAADVLTSAFHLTYNMVLNLLRVEEINPEYMLERSFHQFQNTESIPEIERKLEALRARKEAIVVPNLEAVEEYYTIQSQIRQFAAQVNEFMTRPKYIVPFLNPGRIVQIKEGETDWGWGAIINFQKKANPGKPRDRKDKDKDGDDKEAEEDVYVVDVLLRCATQAKGAKPKPVGPGDKGEPLVVPIMLPLIHALSGARIYMPGDIRPLDARHSVMKSVGEVRSRFPNGVPLLDPVKEMKITDPLFLQLLAKSSDLHSRLKGHALHQNKELPALLQLCEQREVLEEEIKAVKKHLKASRSIQQLEELRCRKRVLRRLNFCSKDDVIELKGRVACEISTGDELLITEMIFNGVFNDLTPQQCASLMSCFVFEEKSEEGGKLKEELAGPLRQMQDLARRIAKVSVDSKLQVDEEEYVQSFRTEMMDVVFAWAQGAKFCDICKMTDIFEGSIIRAMRRLEELLRQMCAAAKAIGNTELENKFAESISCIKRDIVFAASLYL